MLSHIRTLALAAAVVVVAPFARAHSTGEFGYSGRNGFTCTRCHGGNAAQPTVTVQLAPINTVLPPTSVGYVPGARYTVSISVAGGPNSRWGFDADASAGTGIVTQPTLTWHSSRTQEFTHRSAGTQMNHWSYTWVAPTATPATPVTFWVAVNSANGNGGDTGDGIASTSFVVNPVPPEVVCRLGGVNGDVNNVVNVLSVGGSFGDDQRRVTLQAGGSFSLEIAGYPSIGANPIPYVVYALPRENTAADVTPYPFGLGNGCFPSRVTGAHAITVANIVGQESLTGHPVFAGTPPGPGTILSASPIPANFTGVAITIQAIVPDSAAANHRGALTNAVVVQIQ
jgi:hypothetical protein